MEIWCCGNPGISIPPEKMDVDVVDVGQGPRSKASLVKLVPTPIIQAYKIK
jgi:hypothetical protein